uniref:Uncharacterized protein n=1 Tax=Glossina austeni TaxID=7395 RepID=A0A1A9VJ37_GLOAU
MNNQKVPLQSSHTFVNGLCWHNKNSRMVQNRKRSLFAVLHLEAKNFTIIPDEFREFSKSNLLIVFNPLTEETQDSAVKEIDWRTSLFIISECEPLHGIFALLIIVMFILFM